MTKNTKRLLFAFVGIVVMIAASFAVSRTIRENFREMAFLLSYKYKATPANPLSKLRNEAGSVPSVSNGLQANIGSTTTTPQKVEVGQATSSTPQKTHNVYSGPALYRNDEFGFEFTIPDGWQVKENMYWTTNSYFNLTLWPLGEKLSHRGPVEINVAKSDFIERSYRSLESFGDPITINGVNGTKYEYPFEGSVSIDYILPRSQDTFVIGAWKRDEDFFNEVVASFRFLK